MIKRKPERSSRRNRRLVAGWIRSHGTHPRLRSIENEHMPVACIPPGPLAGCPWVLADPHRPSLFFFFFAHEEHILLLNCTFTFTQTISKSWKKCGVGVGGGTGASQEPGPRLASPDQGGGWGGLGDCSWILLVQSWALHNSP